VGSKTNGEGGERLRGANKKRLPFAWGTPFRLQNRPERSKQKTRQTVFKLFAGLVLVAC